MHDDWLPISDYPIPEFDQKNWFVSAARILVWTGHFAVIASYGYTKTGKGRFLDHMGRTVVPTHWMALPGPPTH